MVDFLAGISFTLTSPMLCDTTFDFYAKASVRVCDDCRGGVVVTSDTDVQSEGRCKDRRRALSADFGVVPKPDFDEKEECSGEKEGENKKRTKDLTASCSASTNQVGGKEEELREEREEEKIRDLRLFDMFTYYDFIELAGYDVEVRLYTAQCERDLNKGGERYELMSSNMEEKCGGGKKRKNAAQCEDMRIKGWKSHKENVIQGTGSGGAGVFFIPRNFNT